MKKLVIMLHGVGSNGADLQPIAQYWQQNIPEMEFASPNAPFTFMNSPQAFQWFSLNGITPENRSQRIVAAREAFDQTIMQILQQHQMQQHLDQVIFCGFSQGTIMALDAIVSGRWNIAAVIGLSGRLASEIETEHTATQILLMHGEADPVIPVQESIEAQQKLAKAGFQVNLKTYPHLPHSVTQDELEQGLRFLNQVFF